MSSTSELLDREEERTLRELQQSFSAASRDVPVVQLRALARRNPELTLAASVALGFLFAPLLAGAARSALPLLLRAWRSEGGKAMVGMMRRSML